jgi:hypothetical protein
VTPLRSASAATTAPEVEASACITAPSPSPSDGIPPPAKRVRKRRNEAELLRGIDDEEESELLLSPVSSPATPAPTATPPSSTPPSASSPPLHLSLTPPAPCESLQLSPPTAIPAPSIPPLSPIAADGHAELAQASATSDGPPSPATSPSPATPPTPSSSTPSAVSPSSSSPSNDSLPSSDASTIPPAPPFSKYLPSCPFKVICRLCFRDNHDICYKQCPSCYKRNGGTNYFGW